MKLAAFTLFELLIAVSLLLLLSAFTVPTFQILISQIQLNTATNQVADILRLDEQRTLTQQQIYGVTLVASSTTVPQFLCLNVACAVSTDKSMLTPTYTLPTNVVIDQVNFSGNTDIRFATSGAPSTSGELILLDTSRNKRRKIEVRPSGAIIYNFPEY